MYFIVYDLELNQDISSLHNFVIENSRYPFEIIQIGAVKIDMEMNVAGTFNRYVKPAFYSVINPFVSQLTGIENEQLQTEELFPVVFEDFISFLEGSDSILCSWGMSDIADLYRNAEYHKLNSELLPKMYIDLQPYTSLHLKISEKNQLRLQHAVELLNIPITYQFHNAFHDALYTAEIFKKIYCESVLPKPYNPFKPATKPTQPKREIDFDRLIHQLEKMYAREMNEEEREIIKLAYKMGRTGQFLK